MTVSKITRIRDAAVGDQLGQEDAEAPDVALDAEPAVVGGHGRGPLDGEPGSDTGLVLDLLISLAISRRSSQCCFMTGTPAN